MASQPPTCGRPPQPMAGVPAALGWQCKAGVDDAIGTARSLIDGLHSMQAETLALLQSRMKETLAAGHRLAECTSPGAAVEVQLEFAQAALQAYSDQFKRLTAIACAMTVIRPRSLPRNDRLAGQRTASRFAAPE